MFSDAQKLETITYPRTWDRVSTELFSFDIDPWTTSSHANVKMQTNKFVYTGIPPAISQTRYGLRVNFNSRADVHPVALSNENSLIRGLHSPDCHATLAFAKLSRVQERRRFLVDCMHADYLVGIRCDSKVSPVLSFCVDEIPDNSRLSANSGDWKMKMRGKLRTLHVV